MPARRLRAGFAAAAPRPDVTRTTHRITIGSTADFFARTVGGLEGLAAAELAEHGCTVVRTSRRQLVVRGPADALWPEPPRTVDDLFHLVLTLDDPGRGRGTPAELGRRLRSARFDVPRDSAWISVSASFAGARSFSRYDLEDEIGATLAARCGSRYSSRRDGRRPHPEAVDWRVTLDGDRALVGLRPGARPLHRRPWKTASIPGTLHPPVAAAMARLAGIRPGLVVVDPCCGAGTILIEAAGLCPAARFAGGDIDPAALTAASTNRQGAIDPAAPANCRSGIDPTAPANRRGGADRAALSAARVDRRGGVGWQRHDSAALPYLSGSVDRIVTNPPWGVRVAEVRTFSALLREWRRVIRPDGRLVCLADPDQLSAFDGRDAGWRVMRTLPISLSGRHPHIVLARPHR
jgi:23S rRNA G2445 N2-methylase RlmL